MLSLQGGIFGDDDVAQYPTDGASIGSVHDQDFCEGSVLCRVQCGGVRDEPTFLKHPRLHDAYRLIRGDSRYASARPGIGG